MYLACGAIPSVAVNAISAVAAEKQLKKNPKASDAELRDALAGLKCRCGTHVAILRAIKRAQSQLA